MPGKRSLRLRFPFAGVSQHSELAWQEPFSSPSAVNVRGECQIDRRRRGGSRPGLVALSTTTTNESEWQWPNGETIQWPDGQDMTYELSSSEAALPDGTKVVKHGTIIQAFGDAPAGYTVSCIYRDRLILIKDNLWWASRMGDHADWSIADDKEDAARAVAGAVGLAGDGTEPIIAAIPFRDDVLVLATRNSLWVLRGDPATGQIEILSDEVGIIAPYAWALYEGTLAFLSNDGVYIGSPTSAPQRFSEERMPEELRNVDTDNTITMGWDPDGRGFHLFITPASGVGNHYWLGIEDRSFWPVSFFTDDHQPVATARIKNDGLHEMAVLGRDSTWRKFSQDATDDDGSTIVSRVVFGPFRLASSDMEDGLFAELHGILAVDSGVASWTVYTGDTAEEVADNAASETGGTTGGWNAGRNRVVRPRQRGAFAAIALKATDRWAFESMSAVTQQLGRIR